MNSLLPRILFSTLAFLTGVAVSHGQRPRPPSTPVVQYAPDLTKVEGNQPLTTTIVLSITSPSNLPVGIPVTITPSLTLLSAPADVPESIALSFVTLTPVSLTFTGPNQTLSTIVEGVFPLGVAAGDYSYQIRTPGWGVEAQDQGAFLNATIYPLPTPGSPPTVEITTPVDNAQFIYRPLVGPLEIPISFDSSAELDTPITAIDADINGIALPITSVDHGDGSFTSTASVNITAGGIYTVRARASNSEGTAEDDVSFEVTVEAPPPVVTIGSPANGSGYTLPASGGLMVPYTFTARSYYGGITSLTATLNGNPVTFTPAGLNTLTATGGGNFSITAGGVYELVVTAEDRNGTASASTSFTVDAYVPPPSVSITEPLHGATFTREAGSAPTLIPFTFVGTTTEGYTITSLTGTLNGQPVTATVAGLGTASATGTGNLSVSTPGTYTLSAAAVSAGGTAATSVTFTVTETAPPPPPAATCKINWLPPISLGKPIQGCSQVPIKFELDCCACSGHGSGNGQGNGNGCGNREDREDCDRHDSRDRDCDRNSGRSEHGSKYDRDDDDRDHDRNCRSRNSSKSKSNSSKYSSSHRDDDDCDCSRRNSYRSNSRDDDHDRDCRSTKSSSKSKSSSSKHGNNQRDDDDDCDCSSRHSYRDNDRDDDGDPDHYPGQRTKCKTSIDKNVVIAVTELLANGNDGSTTLYSYSSNPNAPGYTIQGNDMYHVNHPVPNGSRRYRIEVFTFRNGSETPLILGTREFTTK